MTVAPARVRATLVGCSAVLLWATLALLTTLSGAVPPFLLMALTFAIGGTVGMIGIAARGGWAALRQPVLAWGIGVGGLFGFHFCYFLALGLAPPVEVSLITYSWPLLIVLFSSAVGGGGSAERLRWFHAVGALAGFAGTGLLIGRGIQADLTAWPGYALGLLAAFLWAGYSLLSRRFSASVPTDAVAGFCLATAALAAVCHGLLEPPGWPEGAAWIAVALLGLGPVGLAFFAWDHGLKHGDVRLLGVAAYGAPLLSTILLLGWRAQTPGATVVAGALLIVGGALLASRDLWWSGTAA